MLFQSGKNQKRIITISGTIQTSDLSEELLNKNKKNEVNVELNELDYNTALLAHKDSKKVIIKGDLFKKNKYDLKMPKVKEFLVLSIE